MITEDRIREAEGLLDKCYECINKGRVDNFASYEEGVKDTLDWLLYGGDKPSVGMEE